MKIFKPTSTKRFLFFLIGDIFLLGFSFYFSYSLRFDFNIDKRFYHQLWYWLPFVILIKILLLNFFNLYSITWRFVSITEFFSVIKALTIALFGIVIFDHFAYMYSPSILIPRSVPFMDYFISIFLICLFRISKRAINELLLTNIKSKKKTLIIGAGASGERVVRALISDRKNEYFPVGFVDDDKIKQNTRIHGVKIKGKLSDISKIIENENIEAIIIAIPDIPYYKLRKIIDIARRHGIMDIKIVPSLFDNKREFKLTDLKELNVESLLSREVVKIEGDKIRDYFRNKNILVTGAGGSIGSEICRQLIKFSPNTIVGYEIDETELHNLMLELNNRKFIPVVGDVKDKDKFDFVLKEYKINVIFHAAAYKHVPMMEEFPEEAVKTNILGTFNIVKLAIENKIEKFVNISTDKAVNPINVMGITKRISEIICSSFNNLDITKFISVRFGNVLGSRGSVIPIFLEQIKKGGPITVTHPEMERFFMTIPEAVLLVLQATIMGEGGEVFILDMGEPVKIVELAENLIRLQGMEPGKDIKIVFTGLRPGEKIKEELLNSSENQIETSHKKIFKAKLLDTFSIEDIEYLVKELKENKISKNKVKEFLIDFLNST